MILNNAAKSVSGGLIIFVSLFISSCDPDSTAVTGNSDQFESVPLSQNITPGIIDEASGLAASLNIPGYLWTLQDSGQPNSLYLVSQDGKNIKEFNIPGSVNRDWEDMATGPGPNVGVSYVYIADTGNNNEPKAAENTIYRIPEISDINGSFNQSALDKIVFSYPDGPRDAESIILDPVTKDLFIISKEVATAGIYRLAYPQSLSETITAEKLGNVPTLLLATGGNISSDGSEIIIRNYFGVYYWQRNTGETVGQTLLRKANKQLTVASEPQGEAVCFDKEANGFYTLSEKANAASVSLNYYKRK